LTTLCLALAAAGCKQRPVAQTGHSSPVNSVAFSPDGKILASGSDDRTIKLWDAATGAALRTLRHSEYVESVTFSLDGKTLASAGILNTVKLWDVSTGAELRTLVGTSQ